GIGPASISYVVAANGGAARSGLITIAGRTLTVNQGAGEVPFLTSVTNAASFVPGIVPGSLITIFGVRLSTTPSGVQASTIPWPIQLTDTSVKINGIDAPLYYVSGNQLNLQVPWELAAQRLASIVVTSNGRSSEAFQVGVLTAQPGVFMFSDGTG